MGEKEKAPKAEAFDLEGWLEEGRKGLRDRLKGERPQLLPDEFKQHTRAARKEMLLAVRSLLDAVIDKLDGEAEAQEAK